MRSPVRHVALGTGVVATLALVWAWIASGPLLVLGLNWDTASYIALYASGNGSWRDLPWNSHFALGPIYSLGYALVRPFGGTFIDGARALGALAFAMAVATAAHVAQRLCGWVGALWAGLYAGAWGVGVLLLTVEDNVLYLPVAVGLLALAVLRLHDWRWHHSVTAGALGALGILVSWQAGLYLFAPLYVAALHGGAERSVRRRVRDLAALVATTLATLHVYLLVFRGLSDATSLPGLWHTLFSRPSPSFFPTSWHDVFTLLSHPRQVFRHVGLGVVGTLGHNMTRVPWLSPWLPGLGLLSLLAVGLATAWATARARRTGRWHLQVVLTVSLGLLIATALYVDLPADKHKRYDFVPLIACFLGAAAWGEFELRKHNKAWGPAALALLCMLQFIWVVAGARAIRKELPQREPLGYHARGEVPWFVYFRQLRRAHPHACRFTFSFDETWAHARYQLEIPAGLWSELPDHRLVGDPTRISDWPRPVKMVSPQELEPALGCEWRDAGLATRP